MYKSTIQLMVIKSKNSDNIQSIVSLDHFIHTSNKELKTEQTIISAKKKRENYHDNDNDMGGLKTFDNVVPYQMNLALATVESPTTITLCDPQDSEEEQSECPEEEQTECSEQMHKKPLDSTTVKCIIEELKPILECADDIQKKFTFLSNALPETYDIDILTKYIDALKTITETYRASN